MRGRKGGWGHDEACAEFVLFPSLLSGEDVAEEEGHGRRPIEGGAALGEGGWGEPDVDVLLAHHPPPAAPTHANPTHTTPTTSTTTPTTRGSRSAERTPTREALWVEVRAAGRAWWAERVCVCCGGGGGGGGGVV